VTNLPLTPLYLWRFYNDRSQAELVIRQLKEAYACLNWFKRYCTPPAFQRATLQRLRQQFFLAPALLVRPAGRPTLRLAASYPHQEAFRETLRRIAAFRLPWE
jgi:hypothetical protein